MCAQCHERACDKIADNYVRFFALEPPHKVRIIYVYVECVCVAHTY